MFQDSAKKYLSAIWAELSTSENQSNWFEYAESHLAHLALGFLSVALVSAGWYQATMALDGSYLLSALSIEAGFPYKAHMASAILIFWVSYEHITQGWDDLWGNVEDLAFLYLYGALPAILLFSEVKAGEPFLSVNITHAGPAYAVFVSHILTGIAVRIYKAVIK